MLWRIGENETQESSWKARCIKDGHFSEQDDDYIDENQILWGTQMEESDKGFTLVADGSEGLKHAVPLTDISFSSDKGKLYRPLRLQVRYYIDYDEDGVARIYLSRLVNLIIDCT